MKLALRYISFFTIMLVAFSCEFDENGKMPDDIKEVCFPYLQINSETSSPFFNMNDPEAYTLNGIVDVIFKDIPFDKLRVVVVYSGNFETPYTLVDNITSVPFNLSVSGNDLLSSIEELSDFSQITLDDNFKIYVIPTVDGQDYPPYQLLDGKVYSTVSASIYNNLVAFTGSNSADVNVSVMMVCDLANGANDLAGSWDGTDAWFWPGSGISTTAISADTLLVNGLGAPFIEEWWGETVIEGGSFKMFVSTFGTLTIPRQYIYTTEYEGDPYDYEIEGSGFWDNCGTKPVLKISYDIYYAGDVAGLAATYSAYLDGNSYLYTEITLQ
ncbi:MAG: hypothetical protein JXB34_01050 [Bacteroidales bacterium]|nr:hypothetical protein [Bacteroidales bacterium]